MNPQKALGPNGFLGLFYEHYWDEVGGQVILVIQSFFRSGWMLRELYQTFITLIQKSKWACNFNQSVQLVFAMCATKLLRLAFVPNSWITENMVISLLNWILSKLMKKWSKASSWLPKSIWLLWEICQYDQAMYKHCELHLTYKWEEISHCHSL